MIFDYILPYHFCTFLVGVRTFQEWMKYRYGVFPEIGFPGDKRYPEYYEVGPEIRKNEGCNTTYEEKVSDSTISRQMVSFLKRLYPGRKYF